MMSFVCNITIVLALFVCITAPTAFCQELNGWIKGDMRWIVKSPSVDASVIGIILKKAAVNRSSTRLILAQRDDLRRSSGYQHASVMWPAGQRRSYGQGDMPT